MKFFANPRPTPPSAEHLLNKLKGLRFDVEPYLINHGDWFEEGTTVVNEEVVLQTIRQQTGVEFVAVMVEGDYRPPGLYPFSRLTVVLSLEGEVVRTFFG